MWAVLPLLYFVVPPLSLFAASFTLFQFSRIYINLVQIVSRPASGQIWKTVRPYVKPIVKNLQATLGDEDKFLSKVNPTHVILTAILLVLIVYLERLITQTARQHSRR
eukprot:TRINITY_DN16779_c0_g1_i1.p3 TRINITY_DN16779_c0_g1~~TRINITY_DN16779_c0_g1_i1.p3  ORF type:complete len:108 (+),score=18.74 TRINITY_DN16779_c0_g1_i1:146-469(+)